MVFATATARDAALPTPTAGMICYQTDVGKWYGFLAGAWTDLRGIVVAADATARNTAYPTPDDGQIVYLQDVDKFTARIDGAWVNLLAETSITYGAWTAYTPTWQATTAPSLGNGSLTGRYRKIGRTLDVEHVAHRRLNDGVRYRRTGSSRCRLRSSGRAGAVQRNRDLRRLQRERYMDGRRRIAGTGRCLLLAGLQAAAARVLAAVPFTWATGDSLSLSVTYEQ